MNETTELVNTVASEPQKTKRRGKPWWFILLGMVGIVAIISYLGWQQFMQSQQTLQQQVMALQNQVTTLESEFQAWLSEDEEEQVSSDQIEAQLHSFSEQLQQLSTQQTTLANQVRQPHPREEDWVFPETVYLLTMAQYHLKFAQDVEKALTALKEAEANLGRLNQPVLQAVRTELAAKMQELSQIKLPDIDQLAARLAYFATQAESLPLIQGSRHLAKSPTTSNQEAPATETWQDWGTVVWNQVKQLVVIRYSSEADRGLLSAEQRDFVTQSLRLKLEMARFSLWRRDTYNFTTSLQAARDWLSHYYDLNNSDVKTLQEDLAQMQKEVLSPKLPELSKILQQLQQLVISNFSSTFEPTEITP